MVLPMGNETGAFHARFASSSAAAVDARRALVEYLISLGYSREQVADLECAAGEALANAAEHGFREGSSFDVRAYGDGDAIVVEIHDDGPGFLYANGGSSDPPASGSPRGFGIYIMRQLVDDIAYSDRGRRIRLRKRLAFPSESRGDVTATGA